MTRKRSTQSGSSSATAKLINKINKFGKNAINNTLMDANEQKTYHTLSYDEEDTFILTTKQKQQLQRNEYLELLTKEQLKIEAKRRGQKTLGTKSELVLSSLPIKHRCVPSFFSVFIIYFMLFYQFCFF